MYENLKSYQTSNRIVLITANSLLNTTCSVFTSDKLREMVKLHTDNHGWKKKKHRFFTHKHTRHCLNSQFPAEHELVG